MTEHEPTKITRAEAKARGLKRYFTGEPCPHGHVSERWASSSRCIACHHSVKEENKLRARAYYAANREKQLERCRRSWLKNPEPNRAAWHNWRAKKLGIPGRITAADIRRLVETQGNRCAYCSAAFGEKGVRHVDHIVSFNKGGTNEHSNVQLLCSSCSQRKYNKSHEEFTRQRRLL